MWDSRGNPHLQRLARAMFENGRIVASVCHGYTAFADLRLTNGQYLVKDKRMTGFSWTEEIVAGVAKNVPYNAEDTVRQQGARYTKARLPLTSFAVRDGNLITGARTPGPPARSPPTCSAPSPESSAEPRGFRSSTARPRAAGPYDASGGGAVEARTISSGGSSSMVGSAAVPESCASMSAPARCPTSLLGRRTVVSGGARCWVSGASL